MCDQVNHAKRMVFATKMKRKIKLKNKIKPRTKLESPTVWVVWFAALAIAKPKVWIGMKARY